MAAELNSNYDGWFSYYLLHAVGMSISTHWTAAHHVATSSKGQHSITLVVQLTDLHLARWSKATRDRADDLHALAQHHLSEWLPDAIIITGETNIEVFLCDLYVHPFHLYKTSVAIVILFACVDSRRGFD
jgi:hypothetical protein